MLPTLTNSLVPTCDMHAPACEQAPEATPLHMSEIDYASGFSDPAHVARVFKKHLGESPREFRARGDARRAEKETQPRTIYFDHEDSTRGQPVEGGAG